MNERIDNKKRSMNFYLEEHQICQWRCCVFLLGFIGSLPKRRTISSGICRAQNWFAHERPLSDSCHSGIPPGMLDRSIVTIDEFKMGRIPIVERPSTEVKIDGDDLSQQFDTPSIRQLDSHICVERSYESWKLRVLFAFFLSFYSQRCKCKRMKTWSKNA